MKKHSMKTRLLLAAVGAVAALATAGAAAQVKERTLKFAFQNQTGHPQAQGAQKFADIVTAKSGGKITVKLFPGGTLGGCEIDANPKLFIVSQPTWGVDVGAAALIRGEILALRDAGCAVLVVSEELDELFDISDRLHVIAKGRLSPSVDRAAATLPQIGEWMSGLWEKKNNNKEATHA